MRLSGMLGVVVAAAPLGVCGVVAWSVGSLGVIWSGVSLSCLGLDASVELGELGATTRGSMICAWSASPMQCVVWVFIGLIANGLSLVWSSSIRVRSIVLNLATLVSTAHVVCLSVSLCALAHAILLFSLCTGLLLAYLCICLSDTPPPFLWDSWACSAVSFTGLCRRCCLGSAANGSFLPSASFLVVVVVVVVGLISL